MPSLSHLISCTPTKYNLHSDNSLATDFSEVALYTLQTLQVQNSGPLSIAYVIRQHKYSVHHDLSSDISYIYLYLYQFHANKSKTKIKLCVHVDMFTDLM
jgi:hypothetical protein